MSGEGLAVGTGVAAALLVTALAVAVAIVTPTPVPLPPSRDPGCAIWTDECVRCVTTGPAPACSLPGIACVRGPERCVERR